LEGKMRDLLKKYYEMEESTKENLGTLYIIHEFESLLNEFENLSITRLEDTETIIKTTVECWDYSNIDGGEIMYRLLHLLNEDEITVAELKDMDIENVMGLITFSNDDFKEIPNKSKIYEEFYCENWECTFLNDKDRLILIYEKENHVEVLVFNSFIDMLCHLVKYHKEIRKMQEGLI